MATTHPAMTDEARDSHDLSVMGLAITAGITAAVVFVLCWFGTFVPFSSPTHAYINLFTNADFSSGLALAEGTCWSLLFGLVVGALFALTYNVTAGFGRGQKEQAR